MAKGARMSTQDVIDAIYSDDDDFDVGNPDEPSMDGSDYDFRTWRELDDDHNDEDMDTWVHHTHLQPALPSSNDTSTRKLYSRHSFNHASAPTLPAMWTTRQPVTHDTIPVQSAVVPVPDSPLEVFELLFTAPLMQVIVDESNR